MDHKSNQSESENNNDVLSYLPHRFPFLLVDKIITCQPGERLQALKNVSHNEPFFMGHFPQNPVMPGVLIIEALAQAAGILIFKTLGSMPNEQKLFYLAAVSACRFRRVVLPGDQLLLNINLIKRKRGIWKFAGEARVGDQIACVTELTNASAEVN